MFILFIWTSSRYIDRLTDNENDDEYYRPYYYRSNDLYRPRSLERYLRNLVNLDLDHDDKYDESIPFERRTKAIIKGDPREFMG